MHSDLAAVQLHVARVYLRAGDQESKHWYRAVVVHELHHGLLLWRLSICTRRVAALQKWTRFIPGKVMAWAALHAVTRLWCERWRSAASANRTRREGLCALGCARRRSAGLHVGLQRWRRALLTRCTEESIEELRSVMS